MVMTPAQALSVLDRPVVGPGQAVAAVEAAARGRAIVADASPGPPFTEAACLEAAVRFAAGGHADATVLLDARIAAGEFGERRHIELLIWMLDQADRAILTPGLMTELTNGLPLALVMKLPHADVAPWVTARRRLLGGEALSRTLQRDLLKTLMRGATALRDSAGWAALLAAFGRQGKAVKP